MNLSLSVELKENQLQVYVLDSPIGLKPIGEDAFLLEGTMDNIKFNRNIQDPIVELDYKGIKFRKEK